MNTSLKATVVAAGLAASVFIAGCAGMTPTQQRTATGTLGGAAAGSIIGAMAGNAGMGAGIGAGVGMLGGFAYGRHRDAVDQAYQQGRASGAAGR